jgi:hypothetical protein
VSCPVCQRAYVTAKELGLKGEFPNAYRLFRDHDICEKAALNKWGIVDAMMPRDDPPEREHQQRVLVQVMIMIMIMMMMMMTMMMMPNLVLHFSGNSPS